MKKKYSWLQLSDLHVFESTDWNLMLDSYKKLANVINPDFLVVTGDYRHKKYNTSYEKALEFLNQIVKIFRLKKKDVFLVPGNHDVNDYDFKKEIITTIRTEVDSNADAYYSYMTDKSKNLRNAFEEYCDFVREFYGDEITDERLKTPCDVMCIPWENTINIIILNTALISRGDPNEKEIVDIRTFSGLKLNNSLPNIVLAHHDISALVESHQKRIINILNNINSKAYLCGDEHKIRQNIVSKYSTPNSTIPRIVCGKSAVEMTDDFSDLCAIEYRCEDDGNVYVQVYRYKETGFVQSNDFYYNVNKQFHFPMYNPKSTNIVSRNSAKTSESNEETEKLPTSIWLPDAELAKGRQTRFNSFIRTDAINKFFDNDSGYLGIVSVKGIGKTFLLQVKRIKSARKYYCLPKCAKPSVKNNWATERVSFDTYSKLKTDNIYDDLVLLWKMAIKCYVINHLKNEDNTKTINEYVNNGKLSAEIASLCIDEHKESLESILENIVNINKWPEEIACYHTVVSNLCKLILRRRKKEKPLSKDIAIFIDKVDQAIKQTNAEPPADCVVCKKKNNYIECNSHHKSPEYCTEDSGCQSKNCCYGCELFAGIRSNEGLRIYENSNAAKRVHVNIWQYLQLALMNAAGQLSDEFNGEINVFYTIRQEAFNCEENRLGEQNQKIAGKTIHLSYSAEEQRKIFLGCIKEQDPLYLFDASQKEKEGLEEYAFVGVKSLCHPYCLNSDGTHQTESLFTSIYRHSFDRSRDIQRFGEELTNNIERIKACEDTHDREELVKQIIEDLASSLAYCSKQSESTVNPSYYTEKMHYLPNYWADNENFEKLLSMIDRNLLFEEDIKSICRKINGHKTCPISGCRGGQCKRHPFSMLYNMGYLGYIRPNPNNTNSESQQFLDSSEISYFVEADDLITADRVAYIVHPALTKAIEKKFNKTFMHFSGFILGKGLKVQTELMSNMINDRKKLDPEEFLSKYYFKP